MAFTGWAAMAVSATTMRRPTTAAARRHRVLSLAQGPDGDLWVGTFGDGVYRLGRDGSLRH
ncbi:hypothetical protein C7E17_26565, partial [Stenotrophomonas maltophilia]